MNREINYISILYIIIIMKILSITTRIITLVFSLHVAPKNTLICKLDLVYRCIVYNERTCLWPFHKHYCRKKKISYIESFCYNLSLYKVWLIFFFFGDFKKSIVFAHVCSFI